MTLFLKECKKVILSIPYLIFAAAIIIFYFVQITPEFVKAEKPAENGKDYGIKSEEDPAVIMPAALQFLFYEFSENYYTAYPLGFYKNIKLSDKKQAKIAGILSELTGVTKEELLKTTGSAGQNIEIGDGKGLEQDKNGNYFYSVPETAENTKITSVTLSDSVIYDRFLELMEQTDKIIGGESNYSKTYLVKNFGQVPVTYEEALKNYKNIMEKDRITGAYARVFCDYIGIAAALLPVFTAVGIGLKDKKYKMQEIIYTKKVYSAGLVTVRYVAMIIMMMLPVLLLAVCATFSVCDMYKGTIPDYFAFFKYSLCWIAPTLMTSVAVGMFLTELTDSPIAAAVQGFWWFFGIVSGIPQIDGGYRGMSFIIRHNIVGNTQVYSDGFKVLLINRIFYALLSVLLIVLTILTFKLKRGGKFDVCRFIKKIRRNRKSEYQT